jgi:hypothetical protein
MDCIYLIDIGKGVKVKKNLYYKIYFHLNGTALDYCRYCKRYDDEDSKRTLKEESSFLSEMN